MSTSFSPALEPEKAGQNASGKILAPAAEEIAGAKTGTSTGKILETAPFPYASAGEPRGRGGMGVAAESEMVQREQAARALGQREGEERARVAFAEQIGELRETVNHAIHDFARERERYFSEVEAEVVQLALSIAQKVLHREAQVDPLLVAALVRMALEKMEDRTGVKVRAHPQDAGEWRVYFARSIDPHSPPEIVEDSRLERGRCVLETTFGRTEIGLEVQLKEVEQGLMDLLEKRPMRS